MLKHQQVLDNINDAVAEATEVHHCTVWREEHDFSWLIEDNSQNFIGRVNAKVDYGSGLVTFTYRPNRKTFTSVPRITPISVDPAVATDMQEQMKISEMDFAIGQAHNLIEEDCSMNDSGDMSHDMEH